MLATSGGRGRRGQNEIPFFRTREHNFLPSHCSPDSAVACDTKHNMGLWKDAPLVCRTATDFSTSRIPSPRTRFWKTSREESKRLMSQSP